MTKKELIDALKFWSDDTPVSVFVSSLDWDGGHFADDMYVQPFNANPDEIEIECTIGFARPFSEMQSKDKEESK